MGSLSEHFDLKDGAITWHINEQSRELDFWTIDVVISSPFWPKEANGVDHHDNAYSFFDNQLLGVNLGPLKLQAVKILLPSRDGYVSRSDMIEFRMRGIGVQCYSFVTPRQFVRAVERPLNKLSLREMLVRAVGLLVEEVPLGSVLDTHKSLKRLEGSLGRRMAVRWLLPDPIPYRRVALVGGLEEPLSLASTKAMGIGLIVLDKPGNFLEDSNGPFAHLREEFIPFDMSPDQYTSERIVEALKDKKIDGIHTRYDIHHTNVARACTILGLPTSDPQAYAIATNKFDARTLETGESFAFRVRNVAELKSHLAGHSLQYPLIVKPTTGRNSWGVLRCDDEEQLIEATEVAHGRIVAVTNEGKEIHSDVMIEPYVDGPEFDVDLVFWDGELLFYEVSDNFPCAGDIPSDAPENFSHQKETHRDFQETLFVYPSILKDDEKKILVTSLRETVLRLGFRHGVFHVEARVRNSRMEYSIQNGRVDLHPKKTLNSDLEPSCFLIETNPRPPGYLSLLRAGWMYGVDYWALHVLRCINDESRYRAFCAAREREPNHVCALNFIIPESGGILRSGDPGPELALRLPGLMAKIPLYYNEFKTGQFVPPPVSTNFLFMTRMAVESMKGRDDLLDAIRDIRKEWTFDIRE